MSRQLQPGESALGGYEAPVAPPASPAASAHTSPRDDGRSRPAGGADPLRVASWVTAALVFVAGVLAIDGLPVGSMQDDAMYVVLARAIVEGEGLRWIHLPGAPEATHFPPGYPMLLAFLWKLWPEFPANVMLFKAANALFTAVGAGLLVRIAVERIGFGIAAASVLGVVALLSLPTLALSTLVMSEPLFLMLALWALLRVERLVATDDGRERDGASGVHQAAQIGVLLGLSMLVRTHGVALLGASLLVLALRRRWREAFVLGGVATVILLPWQLWVAAHDSAFPPALAGNYGSYTGWLVDGIRRDGLMMLVRALELNVREIVAMTGVVFAATMPVMVRIAALLVIGALSVVGVITLWRRAPVTPVFLGGYLAIVLLWPFSPTRFVWGVWPVVLLVLASGILALWQARPQGQLARGLRFAALAGILIPAVGYAQYGTRMVRGQWWSSIPRATSAAVAPVVRWAATNTSPDAVIVTNLDAVMYLYAGRRGLPITTFTTTDYFRGPTREEAIQALHEIFEFGSPDLLIVAPSVPKFAVSAVEQLTLGDRPALVLRDSFNLGYVFVPGAPIPPQRQQRP